MQERLVHWIGIPDTMSHHHHCFDLKQRCSAHTSESICVWGKEAFFLDYTAGMQSDCKVQTLLDKSCSMHASALLAARDLPETEQAQRKPHADSA